MVYFAKVQLSPKLTCMHEYLPSFYLVFLSLLFAHKHTMTSLCVLLTSGRCGITLDLVTRGIMLEMWAKNTLGML